MTPCLEPCPKSFGNPPMSPELSGVTRGGGSTEQGVQVSPNTHQSHGCSNHAVLGVQVFVTSIFIFSPLCLPAVVQQHSPPCNPGHTLRGCQGCPKTVPKLSQNHARIVLSLTGLCHPHKLCNSALPINQQHPEGRTSLCSAQPKSSCTVLALNLGAKCGIPTLSLSWSCPLPHPLAAPGGSVTALQFLSTEVTTSCTLQFKFI